MSTLTTGTYEKYGASYKTLTLTDGEYAFTVTPEKGGMATSFTKNGDEYLWLRDKNFESTDRPRCGIPILFPNCGKPDDGVHHFNGAAYPIEVHGLADLVPWQVKSADDTAIELTLTPNGLTKFVYPFDFALTMRYTLTGSTATLALTSPTPATRPCRSASASTRTSPPASWTTSRLTSTPPPAAKAPRASSPPRPRPSP